MVSIQGKNVIGIRRVAIERILKQYKVDQEIEIVVCRLKDPTYILNLTNKSSSSSKIQNTNSNNNASSLIGASLAASESQSLSSKYRSINEQIFNELISFQDTLFQNQTKSSNQSLSSSRSSQISTSSKMKKSESVHDYTRKETADNLSENLISIELNSTRPIRAKQNEPESTITLRPNAANSARRMILNSKNINSGQFSSDSGYGDSARKSNTKSTSYYSDISILVYDNIGGNSNVGGASKTTNKAANDVVVVSVFIYYLLEKILNL